MPERSLSMASRRLCSACRRLPRSMNTIPVAIMYQPRKGTSRSTFLATKRMFTGSATKAAMISNML